MTAARPKCFPTPVSFRNWLKAHHRSAPELLVGFYRKDSGRASMTWPESVDEVLCFGWIDGIRRRVDGESYSIRFTPRRPESPWSAINIARVAVLTGERRMRAAGLEAFGRRSEKRSGTYAYEQREHAALSAEHQRRLRANRKAWTFFQAQPPSYRRTMTYLVVSAKPEETRLRRLDRLIAASASGRRL